VQPELTIIALSLWLIVFLGLTCVVYSLVSMCKENRFGRPLKGIIWFTFAIIVSCAIALLAGYVQKAKSSEKASRRVKTVATPPLTPGVSIALPHAAECLFLHPPVSV